MEDLKNKVAIITGASAGIGEGTAVLFAKLGCHLTLTGRNQDRLKAVVQRCVEAGCPADKVVAVTGNIQDKAVQQELLDKTLATFGRLDILVNNAGLTYWMTTSIISDEEYKEIMDVNLKASYFLSRLVVPELIKTKGNIVNVSSMGSLRPVITIDVYCMGKAAMNTFTQTLAREVAPCGVRVNSVLPGLVDSLLCLRGHKGLSEEQYAKMTEQEVKATPLGCAGQPEDVANVIAFLASDMSRFTTGALVVADGGLRSIGQRTASFVSQLIANVQGLNLWCAGIQHNVPLPTGLQVEVLTTPLRSAPVVLEEVRPALDRNTAHFHNYTIGNIPAPGDGIRVRRLRHEESAHTGRWPVHCDECGRQVASELRHLGTGVSGSGITYRDVFVLTRSTGLHDEVKEGDVVKSPASGVVRGIRGEGFSVSVLGLEEWVRDRAGWERTARDVATAATDNITVSDMAMVCGLERKVVVWLHGRTQGLDEQHSDLDIDDRDRLDLVTRCTTQLVVVDVPPVTAQAAGNSNADNNDNDSTKKGGAGGGKKKDNSDDTGVSWARKGFLL